MGGSDESGVVRAGERALVVVPHRVGPLVSLDTPRSKRGRDDLDELIDDLFPQVEEGPGWFDAALVIVGAGLVGWGWAGNGPGIVTVVGVVALALGCILPLRAAWRRAQQGRAQRRRKGLLETGLPIDASSPATAALVGAYEDLLELANRAGPEPDSAIAAAHGALLEVASLLKGRAPTSERELGYVEKRAAAVAALVAALGELPAASESPADDLSAFDPDVLVAALEELDEITQFNSMTRLEELIAEARNQHRDRS